MAGTHVVQHCFAVHFTAREPERVYEGARRRCRRAERNKRWRWRPHARPPKRYRNKQYDLQYDFLGGRDEPRTELKTL